MGLFFYMKAFIVQPLSTLLKVFATFARGTWQTGTGGNNLLLAGGTEQHDLGCFVT